MDISATEEQNEDRQRIALREISLTAKQLYIDKQSGKTFNRPQYNKFMQKLREGDLLYT